MKKEILEAFDIMNDDCIYIEPKLITIIPGDDPAVINKVSDFEKEINKFRDNSDIVDIGDLDKEKKGGYQKIEKIFWMI